LAAQGPEQLCCPLGGVQPPETPARGLALGPPCQGGEHNRERILSELDHLAEQPTAPGRSSSPLTVQAQRADPSGFVA